MGSVSILRRAGVAVFGAALFYAAAGMGSAWGQAPAPGSTALDQSARPEVPPTKHLQPARTAKTRKTREAAEPPPVETRPPDPPPPDWPVNDKAQLASVAWNGRDLSIAAANSSLDQILHDVSIATGLKVEGLMAPRNGGSDQRVYGSYGPASARDVLSKLLDGSGYNVMMVGDRGHGTPRELVLTAQAGGGSGTASGGPRSAQVNQNGEEEAPDEPEPPEQQPEQPFHRQFNGQQPDPNQPGPGARTPQQMLQELQQQRQQQQQPQPGIQVPPPNN